jgi:hypothetical protein
MKWRLLVACLAFYGLVGCSGGNPAPPVRNPGGEVAPQAVGASGTDAVLADALERHKSNVQVDGEGEVVRVLSDDNDGDRHQRFILRLASGQTLLFAHNIDLAPRVDDLRAGDRIEFKGEYEWNGQGGVVHWTHRDPAGRHVAGWLKHDGRTYQ